ncbi:DUF6573 family protein [Nocardiopsis synnemataformans]|uniref:DUF6573 family protein n=1 Tax=Nocardiopsis synnemataformans TaxID=61305 RepID=UPI003EBE2BC4
MQATPFYSVVEHTDAATAHQMLRRKFANDDEQIPESFTVLEETPMAFAHAVDRTLALMRVGDPRVRDDAQTVGAIPLANDAGKHTSWLFLGHSTPAPGAPRNPFEGAPVIVGATRADLIKDGELIAVPEDIATASGFTISIAITRGAWEESVRWEEGDGPGQSEQERLRELLRQAMRAIKVASDGLRAHIRYMCVRRGEEGAEPLWLLCVLGPGDSGEHVLTIMRPDES